MSHVWKRGVLITLMTLSVSSCGEQTPPPPTVSTPPITVETKKEVPATVVNANLNAVTINSNANTVQEMTVGTRVASKWTDGNYWAATITDIKGTTYSIKYDDGTNGTNDKDQLVLLSNTLSVKIGDKVLAVWSSNGRFYDGVIKDVKTASAMVQWNDGSAASEVVLGKIIFPPVATITTSVKVIKDAPVAPVTGTIIVGSRVASKWADGKYWAATVTKISGSTYTLAYDDGTNETNTKDKLILLSDKITLKVGDKVLAVWSSNGRFYDGVVTAVKALSATVKWDDGSAPSDADFGKIMKK